MKKYMLVSTCLSTLFMLQTELLRAEWRKPATDYVGAMFNLNLVFPSEGARSEDDVEDLYGVFFSLFPGSLDVTDRYYHGIVLSGMGVVGGGDGIQGGICYWGGKGRGISFGLLSTGFSEMEGVQIGAVTGVALATSRSFINLTDLKGIQVGGINLANTSWGQCGIWNYVNSEGCVQFGFINSANRTGRTISSKASNSTFQIGLFNYISEAEALAEGVSVQIGILNRTSSGWWLPISNFGL